MKQVRGLMGGGAGAVVFLMCIQKLFFFSFFLFCFVFKSPPLNCFPILFRSDAAGDNTYNIILQFLHFFFFFFTKNLLQYNTWISSGRPYILDLADDWRPFLISVENLSICRLIVFAFTQHKFVVLFPSCLVFTEKPLWGSVGNYHLHTAVSLLVAVYSLSLYLQTTQT